MVSITLTGLPHMQLELYDVRISDPAQKKYLGSEPGACAKGSEKEKEVVP